MDETKILALIPARGGSKGIPRKNILPIGGQPLISWSICAAQASNHNLAIVCSTDNAEIAEVARRYGAECPFLRPPELSTDQAQTIDVVLHALDVLDGEFTHVLLLQPTAPLRNGEDIDGAIALSLQHGSDAVISVSEARTHPYLTYVINEQSEMRPFFRPEGASLRRQDLPSVYELNGAIYLNRVESLRATRSFVPAGAVAYPMPRARSVDIDDWTDWKLAQLLLAELQFSPEGHHREDPQGDEA